MDAEVEQHLKQRIIDDVCAGKSPTFHLAESAGSSVKERLKRVLGDPVVDDFQINKAKRAFVDRNSAADKILLLRGLIHSGILLLCLKKRWNVQYGLHPDRIPIAVPFEVCSLYPVPYVKHVKLTRNTSTRQKVSHLPTPNLAILM